MARSRTAPCPRCRSSGRDRRGDNLATYADGSAHCFSCGYHVHPKHYLPKVNEPKSQTNTLPRDFTREIPAEAWRWLLQYGLPYSYWQPHCGYSPADERLVITVGSPIRFSVGRYLGEEDGPSKWRIYGDGSRHAALLEPPNSDSTEGLSVVLVEDIISGHKVAQVAPSLTLFGTKLTAETMRLLNRLKRPITLWLDDDQGTLLAPKINRLQALLGASVRVLRTRKDPKAYSTQEIKEILS